MADGPHRIPNGDDLLPGPKRNFQIFDPLDFLAEVTQHIPEQGEHLIRYYGWYSNKKRGHRDRGDPVALDRQEAPAPMLRHAALPAGCLSPYERHRKRFALGR